MRVSSNNFTKALLLSYKSSFNFTDRRIIFLWSIMVDFYTKGSIYEVKNSSRWSEVLSFEECFIIINYWASLIKKSSNSDLYIADYNPFVLSLRVALIKLNSIWALENFTLPLRAENSSDYYASSIKVKIDSQPIYGKRLLRTINYF